MNKMEEIATKIIQEQELIIGPIAWTEAEKVQGIHVQNRSTGELTLESSDAKVVIDQLVFQYERLFGRASREACKEAVMGLLAELAPSDIPSSLQVA